jgi:hypothetical protein
VTPGRWRGLGVATVAAAATALLVPWPAAAVEAWYASGVYPVWQRIATPITNVLPFAVLDVIIVIGVAAIAWVIVDGWRRTVGSRLRRAGAVAGRLLVCAAVLYLWFLASWGLNYQRRPLAERLGLDRRRATHAAASRLADETIGELNRLYPLAHAQPWPEREALRPLLEAPFTAALGGVGARDVVPGRAKASLLQPYFRWAGIDGVTDPFAPEVIVSTDLLPMEWPFTLAHEWGHLAGLAHEAEASYLGWTTCLGGTDQTRYSARLWILGHALSVLSRDERIALVAKLDDGPRGDLRAIAHRVAMSVPAVRQVSWAAYDRYLKTNGVSEGLAAYDAALVLILAASSE